MDNNEEYEKNDVDDEIIVDDETVSDIENSDENVDNDLSEETFTYSIDNNNINNDYTKDYRGSSNDNKSFIYIAIGAFILVLIIVLLIIFANRGNSNTSGYSQVEDKMVSAAKKYYEKNSDLLPVLDASSISVSADVLIENSFLKPFSELISNGSNCSGSVSVFKSGDEYAYFPYLSCGSEYESLKLSARIINSDVVTSGDGLYYINGEYVFRGENPNNFVNFNGKNWRIVKINSDGSIKLIYSDKKIERVIWDDRYNSSRESYVGINDFRISRILDYLKDSYEKNSYVNSNNKSLLVKGNWCIGKISQSDVLISSLNLCSDSYNDLYIGLIAADEILLPSLASDCVSTYDVSCTNYNYFFNINSGWTLNASSDKSYIVFSSNGGFLSHKNASSTDVVRPVVNINGNLLYKSGNGTESDPYIIGN